MRLVTYFLNNISIIMCLSVLTVAMVGAMASRYSNKQTVGGSYRANPYHPKSSFRRPQRSYKRYPSLYNKRSVNPYHYNPALYYRRPFRYSRKPLRHPSVPNRFPYTPIRYSSAPPKYSSPKSPYVSSSSSYSSDYGPPTSGHVASSSSFNSSALSSPSSPISPVYEATSASSAYADAPISPGYEGVSSGNPITPNSNTDSEEPVSIIHFRQIIKSNTHEYSVVINTGSGIKSQDTGTLISVPNGSNGNYEGVVYDDGYQDGHQSTVTNVNIDATSWLSPDLVTLEHTVDENGYSQTKSHNNSVHVSIQNFYSVQSSNEHY